MSRRYGHAFFALSLVTGCSSYTGEAGEPGTGTTGGATAPSAGPEPPCLASRCFATTLVPLDPRSFALDDLDGDGRLDLLLTDARGYGVALGDGAGGFGPPVALGERFQGGAGDIVGGDFDCDGVRDAVALQRDASPAWAALVRGAPGRGETLYAVFPGSATDLAVGDYDGDGCDDVAAASYGLLGVALGDPSGHLRRTPRVGVGRGRTDLAAGDLDGDGFDDLVVANSESDDLSVVLADGAGGFAHQQVIPAGDDPTAVSVADLDLDGALDIVLLVRGGVQVLRGLGDGGFAAPRSYAPQLPGGSSWGQRGLAVCELTGDAYPDVALSWPADEGRVLVLSGGPEGLVGLEVLHPRDRARNLVCRDLDGDGDEDLAYLVDAGEGRLVRLLLAEAPA